MPVDMWPVRFLEELEALPPFRRLGSYDEAIAKREAPPKQAFLPGLFLFGHARGYHLPAWDDFQRYYLKAINQHERYKDKPPFYFTGNDEPRPGFLHRMSGWYEDSIAHAFLHSVLVLAYEDLDQSALVLFDARIDWKMKADLIVLCCDGERTKALRVSIYGQSDEGRAALEHGRDEQERHTKANTSDSSHWRNKTHGALPLLKISKTHGDVIVKQDFHLFSLEAMEQLMVDIDNTLERPRTKAMPIAKMLKYRGK
jgi:hypothetical protein